MTGCELKSMILKHTIADEAGSLVELNVSYPQLSGLDDAYLQKRFNDYYSTIAEGLHYFAGHTLAVLAAKSRTKNAADFKRWAVVSKFTETAADNNIKIRMKLWVLKDGERKEKLLEKAWNKADIMPMLHRLANKAHTGNSPQ